jgi:hypothetical protein
MDAETIIRTMYHMFQWLPLLSVVFMRLHYSIQCSSTQKNVSSFSWPCRVHGFKGSLNRAMLGIFFPSIRWPYTEHHLLVVSCLLVYRAIQVRLAVSSGCCQKCRFDCAQGWCSTWPNAVWTWWGSKYVKQQKKCCNISGQWVMALWKWSKSCSIWCNVWD